MLYFAVCSRLLTHATRGLSLDGRSAMLVTLVDAFTSVAANSDVYMLLLFAPSDELSIT